MPAQGGPVSSSDRPGGRYREPFRAGSSYDHACQLIADLDLDTGLVIDLGCGYGAVAEVVRDRGYTYVGTDVDADALRDLERRGFEHGRVDLAHTERLLPALAALVDQRPVSAVLALDVIEHLPEPARTFRALREIVASLGAPYLIVSIPNVAHAVLGAKLTFGRWDVLPTGLLDDTHLTLFTEARLHEMTTAAGWDCVAAKDVIATETEQDFPAGLPTLVQDSPTSRFFHRLRDQADANGTVYQFVRALRPVEVVSSQRSPTHQVGLSVVVTDHGDDTSGLVQLIADIEQQTTDDLAVHAFVRGSAPAEIEATVERSRFTYHLETDQDGTTTDHRNRAIERSDSRMIAFVSPGDRLRPNWAEEFLLGEQEARGKVIRVPPTESAPHHIALFDWLTHLMTNVTPLACAAYPLDALKVLALRFDDEEWDGWDLLLQAAMFLGVHDRASVTCLARTRTGSSQGQGPEVLLDRHPLLIPPGGAHRIRTMGAEISQLRARVDELEAAARRIGSPRGATRHALKTVVRRLQRR